MRLGHRAPMNEVGGNDECVAGLKGMATVRRVDDPLPLRDQTNEQRMVRMAAKSSRIPLARIKVIPGATVPSRSEGAR